jgi:hypothetical protein
VKVTVLQFDNRPAEALGAMTQLLARNRAYAERQGYDYRFLRLQDVDLPIYWLKPYLVRRALEDGADLVAWLDTDAVVHDLDRRIEPLFAGPEIMVAAPDNPFWSAPFNAGVFFVRAAGGGGAALMARWSALFAGTAWTRTPTAWICQDEWAGPSYEQGAFVAHLLGPLGAAGDLRLVDWQVLQSPVPVDGAFTLHMAGGFRANLAPYLQTIGGGAPDAGV